MKKIFTSINYYFKSVLKNTLLKYVITFVFNNYFE